MLRLFLILALGTFGALALSCGGDDSAASSPGTGGTSDAGADALTPNDDASFDDAFTEDQDVTAPDTSAPLEPGVFYVQIPSSSAGTQGIAARVEHPGTGEMRYPGGAPVVIDIAGGHSPGSLPKSDAPSDPAVANGAIRIQFLFPGGVAGDAASGGTYDYRGPACQQALADVIRYGAGEVAASDGQRLSDRVPFAMPGGVGLVGSSNGGNILWMTLLQHSETRASVRWAATWESPLGPQYVTVELGAKTGPLNPYYVPGSCALEGCPVPGMESGVVFDPAAQSTITDPASNESHPVSGALCVDIDVNGTCGPADLMLQGLGGPNPSGNPLPKVYHSRALAELLASHPSIFPNGALPPYYATQSQTEAYWSARDPSPHFVTIEAALPDLPVIFLATVVDHVQGQPDHPHVRVPLRAFVDAGHAFVRCNPDAAYVAGLTGADEGQIPELLAGQGLPWPGTESSLIPEIVGGIPSDRVLATAAALELWDRVVHDDLSADLDAALVPIVALEPPP